MLTLLAEQTVRLCIWSHIYNFIQPVSDCLHRRSVTACTFLHCLGCSCANPSVWITSVHLAVFQMQTALKWLRVRSSVFLHQFKHNFIAILQVTVWLNPFPAELKFCHCIFIHQRDICQQWGCACASVLVAARDGECGYGRSGNACCPLQLHQPSGRDMVMGSGMFQQPSRCVQLRPGVGSERTKHILCALLYAHPVCVGMHFPLVGKSTAEPGIFLQLQNISFSSGGKVLWF